MVWIQTESSLIQGWINAVPVGAVLHLHVKIHLINLIVSLQQSFQSLLFIQPICPKVILHGQTCFSSSSLKTGGTSRQNVWVRLSEIPKQ